MTQAFRLFDIVRYMRDGTKFRGPRTPSKELSRVVRIQPDRITIETELFGERVRKFVHPNNLQFVSRDDV